MDVLHQPNVLGVIHWHIDQCGYRLFQRIAQSWTELLGILDRVTLCSKGFGELDHVEVAELNP